MSLKSFLPPPVVRLRLDAATALRQGFSAACRIVCSRRAWAAPRVKTHPCCAFGDVSARREAFRQDGKDGAHLKTHPFCRAGSGSWCHVPPRQDGNAVHPRLAPSAPLSGVSVARSPSPRRGRSSSRQDSTPSASLATGTRDTRPPDKTERPRCSARLDRSAALAAGLARPKPLNKTTETAGTTAVSQESWPSPGLSLLEERNRPRSDVAGRPGS
jgi:hypothetical protein